MAGASQPRAASGVMFLRRAAPRDAARRRFSAAQSRGGVDLGVGDDISGHLDAQRRAVSLNRAAECLSVGARRWGPPRPCFVASGDRWSCHLGPEEAAPSGNGDSQRPMRMAGSGNARLHQKGAAMNDGSATDAVLRGLGDALDDLEVLYKDIHSHPELSLQETRTAGVAAERLRAAA